MPNGDQTLAQRIRAKYPGAYDDMDDAALERSVLAKHPEYSDLPRTSVVPATPQATQSSGLNLPTNMGISAQHSLWERIKSAAGQGPSQLGATLGQATVEPLLQSNTQVPGTGVTVGDATRSAQEFIQKGGSLAASLMGPGAGEAGIAALPSTERAGQALGAVRGAIGKTPVELTPEAQQAASRAYELGQRGSRGVAAINKFMTRMTKPDAEPLTFGEARDWYSGMKPSVIERLSTSGSIQKAVAEFKVALGDSIKNAAQREGMLKTYEDAMQEYHKAAVMKAVLAGAGAAALAKAKDYIPPIAALKYLVGSK